MQADLLRLNQLKAQLAQWSYEYYVLDQPNVPDSEYDRYFREVLDLEAAHPEWVTSDSPSHRVGGAPLDEFGKVVHAQAMLSLNNAFDEVEVIAFDRRLREAIVAQREGGATLPARSMAKPFYSCEM